jgi:uncharacterized protein RhaS with RHS repeats
MYMQARYYDPVISRFYSNDPIGFRDVHSFNRYAYANNNPYRYTDPDGKFIFAVLVPLAEYTATMFVADVAITAGVVTAGEALSDFQSDAVQTQEAFIDTKEKFANGDYKGAFESMSESDQSYADLAEKAGETAETISKSIPGNTTSGTIPKTNVDARITVANAVKDLKPTTEEDKNEQ